MRDLLLALAAILVLCGSEAHANTPLTPRFVDDRNRRELEQIMSTPDASRLQIAILAALGIRPETKSVSSDGNYPEGLRYNATSVPHGYGCSTVHVDAIFMHGPQGHLAVDGVYCLAGDLTAGTWTTIRQRVTRLPGLAP
jgi:hypothetical protein